MANIHEMVSDPAFMALPPDQQHAALREIDPDAANLDPKDVPGVIQHLQRQAVTRPDMAAPPAAAGPSTNLQPITTDTMHIGSMPIYDEKSTGPVAGVVRAAKSVEGVIPAVYHAVTDAPKTQDEKDLMTAGSPFGTDWGLNVAGKAAVAEKRLVTDQMVEAYQKGRKMEDMASEEKDPVRRKALHDAAGTYQMASFLPFVGPAAANMSERFAYGDLEDPRTSGVYGGKDSDPWGALAEGITYALVPKVSKETTGLITKIPGVSTILGAGTKAAEGAETAAGHATNLTSNGPSPAASSPQGVSTGLRGVVADHLQKINEIANSDTMSAVKDAGSQSAKVAKLVVGKALDNIQTKASQYLADNGIDATHAAAAVKAATNAVKDQWTLWTDRPPSVSGGSFDADAAFVDELNRSLKSSPMMDTAKSIVKDSGLVKMTQDAIANPADTIGDAAQAIKNSKLVQGTQEMLRNPDPLVEKVRGATNAAVDATKGAATRMSGAASDLIDRVKQSIPGMPADLAAKAQQFINDMKTRAGVVPEGAEEGAPWSDQLPADEASPIKTGNEAPPPAGPPSSPPTGGYPTAPPPGSAGNAGHFHTKLAELAYTDPAFADLQKALTRGQTHGGGVARAESIVRRIPGTGPDVFKNNADVSLTSALEEGIKNSLNDPNIGGNLRIILSNAYDGVLKGGRLNLQAVIKQINEGLSHSTNVTKSNFFDRIEAGKFVADDTARATLIRDAFDQANKNLGRTASFGGPLSAGAALGLGGAIASAGSPLGFIGGAVVGIGADSLIKLIARHAFLNPALPGDGLLMRIIREIPAEEEGGTLETQAAKNAARASGKNIRETPTFKSLTPAQKQQVIQAADKAWGKFKTYGATSTQNPGGGNTGKGK